jgi:hypothetical protein
MKLGYWKLKGTAGIGNTKALSIWHVEPNKQISLDISPICIPFSAMRVTTHREGQYDLTYFVGIYTTIFPRLNFYSIGVGSGR